MRFVTIKSRHVNLLKVKRQEAIKCLFYQPLSQMKVHFHFIFLLLIFFPPFINFCFIKDSTFVLFNKEFHLSALIYFSNGKYFFHFLRVLTFRIFKRLQKSNCLKYFNGILKFKILSELKIQIFTVFCHLKT